MALLVLKLNVDMEKHDDVVKKKNGKERNGKGRKVEAGEESDRDKEGEKRGVTMMLRVGTYQIKGFLAKAQLRSDCLPVLTTSDFSFVHSSSFLPRGNFDLACAESAWL